MVEPLHVSCDPTTKSRVGIKAPCTLRNVTSVIDCVGKLNFTGTAVSITLQQGPKYGGMIGVITFTTV